MMTLHLRWAQARRKALRPQGCSTRLVSPHSGLSFHEFTNSSSLDATYVLRISKSSFVFPLSLPHRPHRAPCGGRGQAGTCHPLPAAWAGAARYLGGASDLDEDGHVLVPDEGQVVAAADGDVQHQVQGAGLHPEVRVRVRPADRVVPVCQHDGQALWGRAVTGLPAPRPKCHQLCLPTCALPVH